MAPDFHLLLIFGPKSTCHNNTKFPAHPESSPLPQRLPTPLKVETVTSHPSLALPPQDEINPPTLYPRKPRVPPIPASRSVLERAVAAPKLPPSFLEHQLSHLLLLLPKSLPLPLPRPRMDISPRLRRLQRPLHIGEISVARRAHWV